MKAERIRPLEVQECQGKHARAAAHRAARAIHSRWKRARCSQFNPFKVHVRLARSSTGQRIYRVTVTAKMPLAEAVSLKAERGCQ